MNSHFHPTAAPAAAPYYPPIWKGLTINRSAHAQDEAFAIGPDGFVWRYLTDDKRGAAGRLVSTGLPATLFALISPDTSPRVLVAVNHNRLCFMRESADLGQLWNSAQPVNFAGLHDARQITELHSIVVNGHPLIGLLAEHLVPTGRTDYRFWVAKWTGQALQFRRSPVALDGSDQLGNQFLMQRRSTEQTPQ